MLITEDCIDTEFFPYEPGLLDGLIHNDHLGTPQKMTNSSGTAIWAADYKPFGETFNITGPITNNLRFPGQYYDAETGVNYNYRRDYNPVLGSYIEADPIGIEEGNQLYAYAGNNPIMRIDPQGLKWVWNCKRRLSWATSPAVFLSFPIFGHCYIKFGDEPLGYYQARGHENWTVYDERTPGTSTEDGGERTLIINRYCLPSWVSDCEYDCLRSKIAVGAQGAPIGGSPWSNNCCTNLDAAKQECKKKCCGK